jgi:hypothetical protein
VAEVPVLPAFFAGLCKFARLHLQGFTATFT